MKLVSKIQNASVAGFLISFLGTLPPTFLNLLALTIAFEESKSQAIIFSIGVVIVELIYVFILLKFANYISKYQKVMKIIELFLIVLLVLTALNYFLLFFEADKIKQSASIYPNVHRFVLGLGLSAVNILQIPFWLAWNTFLLNKEVIKFDWKSQIKYLSGIGIGTFLGLLLFILAGEFSEQSNLFKIQWMYLFIAIMTSLTTLLITYKKIKSIKTIKYRV